MLLSSPYPTEWPWVGLSPLVIHNCCYDYSCPSSIGGTLMHLTELASCWSSSFLSWQTVTSCRPSHGVKIWWVVWGGVCWGLKKECTKRGLGIDWAIGLLQDSNGSCIVSLKRKRMFLYLGEIQQVFLSLFEASYLFCCWGIWSLQKKTHDVQYNHHLSFTLRNQCYAEFNAYFDCPSYVGFQGEQLIKVANVINI